jgi:hypothetical protein
LEPDVHSDDDVYVKCGFYSAALHSIAEELCRAWRGKLRKRNFATAHFEFDASQAAVFSNPKSSRFLCLELFDLENDVGDGLVQSNQFHPFFEIVATTFSKSVGKYRSGGKQNQHF